MCGGTHGSPWVTLGMSYVGQSCVGWCILLANLDMSGISKLPCALIYTQNRRDCDK